MNPNLYELLLFNPHSSNLIYYDPFFNKDNKIYVKDSCVFSVDGINIYNVFCLNKNEKK